MKGHLIDLPSQVEQEDVVIEFERAVSGEHVRFKTSVQHKTWTIAEVADRMYQSLKAIDEESKSERSKKDRTSYAKKFTLEKCEEIVRESLRRAKIKSNRITDDNRQKFLQALGLLRRKSAKRVIYKLSAKALVGLRTSDRQDESCSAAELRRGSKTIFFPPGVRNTLQDEQKEFFDEVENEDGEFVKGRVPIGNSADFKK